MNTIFNTTTLLFFTMFIHSPMLPNEVDSSIQKNPYAQCARNTCIGAVVGAAEVAMPGQICSYLMNQKINGSPIVISQAYKGFAANAIGQAPITALQMGIQTVGKTQIEKIQGSAPTVAQNIAISYVAGAVAAIADTTSNAIQLWLQRPHNTGKSTLDAIKTLRSKCFRGYGPNAFLKEGPFTVGYQTLAPYMQQRLHNYCDNQTACGVGGGVIAGVITACITQPGAVIRNTIQANTAKHTTTAQAAHQIFQKSGVKGFWTGFTARGARISMAIPLYTLYTSKLESYV